MPTKSAKHDDDSDRYPPSATRVRESQLLQYIVYRVGIQLAPSSAVRTLTRPGHAKEDVVGRQSRRHVGRGGGRRRYNIIILLFAEITALITAGDDLICTKRRQGRNGSAPSPPPVLPLTVTRRRPLSGVRLVHARVIAARGRCATFAVAMPPPRVPLVLHGAQVAAVATE